MKTNVRSYPKNYEIDASNLRNELDTLLDKLLSTKVEKNDCQPSVRGTQTASAYFLEIRLPGVTEKDLEVHFGSGNLIVQSIPDEARNGTEKERVISFSSGSKKNANPEDKIKPFKKIYRLPKDADPRGISALFCDGVLSLEISKKLNML